MRRRYFTWVSAAWAWGGGERWGRGEGRKVTRSDTSPSLPSKQFEGKKVRGMTIFLTTPYLTDGATNTTGDNSADSDPNPEPNLI